MTINKYKKALNFRANAKYLTKDFIVPKFTGTEIEIPKKETKEILENILEDYQLRKSNEDEKK